MMNVGRVWDQFLTDRDRIHRERLGPPRTIRFGSRAALLMIDHIWNCIGDERLSLLDAVDRYPLSCGLEGWAAVDRTVELLNACRVAGIPVIHTKPFPPAEGGITWRPPPTLVTPSRLEASEQNGWDIHELVSPVSGELVLDKLAASAFAGTPLASVLREMGVDTILITGNTTSGCVRATSVDAAFHRFQPIVVEDCVYDRTEAAHALSLFDMAYKYAGVVELGVAMDWVASQRSLGHR